jgi:hypothetical protein
MDTKTRDFELFAPDIATTDVPKEHFHLLTGVLFLLAGLLWLPPLGSSLWLDETGSFWIVQGGFGQTIHRALESSGSIPYFVVLWLAKTVGGTSEIVLRIPSVVAMGVATYLLYLLGRRLFDRETGLLGAIVFVASGRIVFAAGDARPYAMALMALIASYLFLVRWLDEGRSLDAVLYVAFSVLTIATHYLIALALLPQVAYALRRRSSRSTPVPTKHLFFAGAAITIFALSVLPNLISLWSARADHVTGVYVTPGTVGGMLVPTTVIISALIAALAGRYFGPFSVHVVRGEPSAILLLGGWFLFPAIALFAVSLLTSAQLLGGKYFLSIVTAAALILGWGLRAVSPYRLRQIAVTAFALLSVGGLISFHHIYAPDGLGSDDWRAAASAERTVAESANTPVLFRPGFSEANDFAWLSDPKNRSQLLTPLAPYPMKGTIIPLPSDFNARVERYLQGIVARDDLLRSRQVILVSWGAAQAPEQAWLDSRLGPSGFKSRRVGMYGSLVVVEYTRESTP